jgi:hypothetical protein
MPLTTLAAHLLSYTILPYPLQSHLTIPHQPLLPQIPPPLILQPYTSQARLSTILLVEWLCGGEGVTGPWVDWLWGDFQEVGGVEPLR